MNIFKIERVDGAWYDENNGFVIIASSEAEVRKIAASHAADEGKGVWLGAAGSRCDLIGKALPDQKIGVLLQDFHAG